MKKTVYQNLWDISREDRKVKILKNIHYSFFNDKNLSKSWKNKSKQKKVEEKKH